MVKEIQNLLSQVAIINNKNEEILSASGGRFNIFEICGVNHYENAHSCIIAAFLNRHGTHSLKYKLLECFLETLDDKFTILDFNYKKSKVITEFSTSKDGRIDILIEDDQSKAIIIENKIHASDQHEQLLRYNRYAKKYDKGYQILYLTLDGKKASEQSGKGVDYLKISYKDDIINWLEKCVSIATRLPMVRETIIQYINHIKQLTNQDMDTKNQEEIIEVISKVESLRVAKAISQNYSKIFNFLAEKHFNPKMEEFAEKKGLKYKYVESKESHIRFDLDNPNMYGKYKIGFTFENNSYHYGLLNHRSNYIISDRNKEILHNNLKNNGVTSFKQSDWWPFYSLLPNLSIDKWDKEIINSDIFFNDCKEKIETLLSAMKNIKINE
ncbi:MAG: PD-(D/E)XK nuclease family protein [Bacteroidales bacterium]|nr:PD-(D/E)XK nuclease family protein [Bacteroidales bacterium]MDD4683854.1 PD-(D/E)XK nuclease family protein [Bacteroidales bacterium]